MEDFSDLPREIRLSNSMWKNRPARLARAPPLKRKTKPTGNQTKGNKNIFFTQLAQDQKRMFLLHPRIRSQIDLWFIS